MDPNDLLIGSTLDIPGKIVSFFQTILDMITSVNLCPTDFIYYVTGLRYYDRRYG